MTEPVEAPAPGRRVDPRLLALAGAVLVILLILLVPRLIGGGGGGPTTTTTAPGPSPGRPPPTTAPGGAAAGPPAETFEVFSTKNPFLPLRGPAVGAGAGAPAGGAGAPAPTGGTAGTAPSGPGGARPGTGGGAPSPGAPGGQGQEPRRGERVALMDVFAERGRTVAQVRVNDTVHKVGAGDAFATRFKVVSLSQAERCGRFLFGDDAFRLCKGEAALK